MEDKNTYLHRFNILKEKLKRNKYLPIFFLILLIISILIINLVNEYKQKSDRIQDGIASEVIRFHVIANSDSQEDQELKLEIKNNITKDLKPLLENVNSVDKARIILSDQLIHMENIANETIDKSGFDYTAKASLERDYFPLKVYGDISLPPGEYETVRIELGKAKGQNWWCIMFPPLCFVDSTYSVVPDSSKEQLQDVLTEEEYNEILIEEDSSTPTNPDIDVKVKFKLFTFFNDVFDLD